MSARGEVTVTAIIMRARTESQICATLPQTSKNRGIYAALAIVEPSKGRSHLQLVIFTDRGDEANAPLIYAAISAKCSDDGYVDPPASFVAVFGLVGDGSIALTHPIFNIIVDNIVRFQSV